MRKRLLTMVSMAFALAALMAWAVPQEWSVDVSKAQPYQFNAYHGETMELKASFFLRGQPYDVAGDDFALFWQTNGMGSAYWTAPATAASNTVSAVFTGAMDPGAPLVYGFIGSTGSNYRASFAVRFAASPGAAPNELPLPVETIDFSKVDAINAPWATTNALEASMALAVQAATNYTDAAALEINGNLSTNYYTAAETDAKIVELAPVQSVNSKTGAVTLTASDVGVSVVKLTDGSTSIIVGANDVNVKNIYLSTNQYGNRVIWLGAEEYVVIPVVDIAPLQGSLHAVASGGVYAALALKAPLASPAFTGRPTTPNMDAQSADGQVANKKYVDDSVAGISVTPLSGQTFDFATMQGVFEAVKACIEALGGSVTDFPAIPVNE